MQPRQPDPRRSACGFTRLELVVVLGTLALLIAVTRPVWGDSRASHAIVCMDNLRRLAAAWLLYADDNGGKYVGNYHGGFVPTPTGKERPWATGWLDWTPSSDNTNTVYLLNARYAALGPYLGGDASVFKCPADEYVSRAQIARGWAGRARSYTLSCAFGEGNVATGPVSPTLLQVRRSSGFDKLSPQRAFVFLEEHPDSINDSLFFVPYPATQFVDLPAALHDGACWFTFADGHLELRRWQSAELRRPVTLGDALYVQVRPGNPDMQWILDRVPQR